MVARAAPVRNLENGPKPGQKARTEALQHDRTARVSAALSAASLENPLFRRWQHRVAVGAEIRMPLTMRE
jgi:hypothetical protein